MEDRILTVQESMLLARIKKTLMDHRYGSSMDQRARDVLMVVLNSLAEPGYPPGFDYWTDSKKDAVDRYRGYLAGQSKWR